jgi:hypothetical protein
MSVKESIQRGTKAIGVAIGNQGEYLLLGGLIGYAVLFAVGIYALVNKWPTADTGWIVLKGLYGVLTIGAPIFFFCEYIAHSDPRGNEDEAHRIARLAHLKNTQDQGRAVWLACAAVVGLMFFKFAA